MSKGLRIGTMSLICLLAVAFQVRAEITATSFGGTLANGGDYEWYYGCSPTSAGMLMGYYDRNGYDGSFYGNLVPGGVAETSTFPTTGPSHLVASTIASPGHIDDFYVQYGNYGDDPLNSGRTLPDDFNCLADFMGTSQDGLSPHLDYDDGNVDGGTSFWNYSDSTPLTYTDIYGFGYDYYNASGMYGIYEYVQYAGYDVETLYNQKTYRSEGEEIAGGFDFDDAKAEIDAGRPFLVHIEQHTMFGYGYDDSTADDIVYVHDTWNAGQHSMIWDSTPAYSNLALMSVTVLELSGGSVIPEPSTLAGLISMAAMGLVLVRRSRRRAA
jgi:hypothetical protein